MNDKLNNKILQLCARHGPIADWLASATITTNNPTP